VRKILNWVKSNKLTAILIVVVAFLVYKSYWSGPVLYNSSRNLAESYDLAAPQALMKSLAPSSAGIGGYSSAAPTPEVTERLVVSTSNLSLLVTDVAKTLTDVRTYVTTVGGYMVDSNLSTPEEAASGTITIRVPAAKLEEILAHLKGFAVRTVSETLSGHDVTDQYVDYDKRLAILNETSTRFEAIATKATTFSDILEANQQIISIQSQIDSIKGQQNYLAKTAEMAKITIYLSEDEYNLPYAPAEAWRPNVILKLAVRHLVSDLRGIGTAAIWTSVYAVAIVPIVLIILVIRKITRKK